MSLAASDARRIRLARRPALLGAFGVLGLLGLAVAIDALAGTRPGFDPYGWLSWGWMTWHGGLSTDAAPSWKPLPYPFTLVLGLFGRGFARAAWSATATAAGLGGALAAGRLAFRLGTGSVAGARDGRRARGAGLLAAGVAAVAVLALHDEAVHPLGYLHYVLSAQSDPMIVLAVLGAVDLGLGGRHRAAWCLAGAAALGRPEVWPFLAVYAVWLWRARPDTRTLVVAGVIAQPLLWFGIPALSARSWFVAGDNALHFGGAPTGDRIAATLGRFGRLTPWPVPVAATLTVVSAVAPRGPRGASDRAILGLAGAVLVWLLVEIAFALHGWPDLGRYLFAPAAAEIVLAAVLLGRLADVVAGPVTPAAVRALGGLAAVLVLAALVPGWVSAGRSERHDLLVQRARTREIDALADTVDRLGAARLRSCGEAISDGLETQTALAFLLGENVSAVGYRYPQPGHPENPIVVFRPRPGGVGWTVLARRQTSTSCRSLTLGGRAGPGGARRSS